MTLDTQPLSTPPETKHPLPSVKTGEGNILRSAQIRPARFERATSASGGQRSIQLSHGRKNNERHLPYNLIKSNNNFSALHLKRLERLIPWNGWNHWNSWNGYLP